MVVFAMLLGSAAGPGCRSPAPPRTALSHTGFLAWLPAGAAWVVDLRPVELRGAPEVQRVLDTVFGAARVRAWRENTALHPHTGQRADELSMLAIASYPGGLVALAPGAGRPGGSPTGQRLTGHGVVALVAAGQPRAHGQLRHALAQPAGGPPGHADPQLLNLAGLGREPIVIHFPQPLELPLGSDVGVLLAQQRGMSIGFGLPSDGLIDVRISLTGTFPAGADSNFERLVESFAQSALGRSFGGVDLFSAARVSQGDSVITIGCAVPTASVEAGVQLLFGDVQATVHSSN